MDAVRELDPDIQVTRIHRRYRERGINHCVEYGNDLADQVVTKKDRHFLVNGVRDNICCDRYVENGLIGSKQHSDGSN